MSEFTASNGIEVAWEQDVDGNLGLAVDGMYAVSAGRDYDALREYVIAEEDKRLGRWRWPENPEFVVHDRGDYVQVIHEPDGASGMLGSWNRAEAMGIGEGTSLFGHAARAYFDAHPEPKPAWHDAKPGEFWEVTLHGERHLAKVVVPTYSPDIPIAFLAVDRFGSTWVSATAPTITSGHLVWRAGDQS